MTRWKAEKVIYGALDAYANDKLCPAAWDRPDYADKLDDLVPKILEAAERNGLDTGKVMKGAERHSRTKAYGSFLRALEANDEEKMEKAALAVIRFKPGIDNLLRSAKVRGIELTKDQEVTLTSSVIAAGKTLEATHRYRRKQKRSAGGRFRRFSG